MSYDMFFAADLTIDAKGVAAARAELDEEGYLGHEDNLFEDGDFVVDGGRLTLRWDGSAPATCFDIMAGVLETYTRHAVSGEAVALQTEDGFGEHFRAGEDDEADTEVEGDEVERLLDHFRT